MRTVKITAVKQCVHQDLVDQYELDMVEPCPLHVGDTFISVDMEKPDGLCNSAWIALYPYVMTIACNGESIHGSWMKDKHTAIVSCNDGVRPMSFLLEPCFDDGTTKD